MKNPFALRRTWGPKPNYLRVLNYERPNHDFIRIGGPCSVETKEQISTVAKHVAACGGTHLRGGVFRAGTYPGQNFGWIDNDLIEAYWYAAKSNGLKNIIEILDYRDINKMGMHCTAFQVGCRQQQNYTLLHELGKSGFPIFLKRHPGSTLDELLGSAEHILSEGCKELYIIERGSSTHMNHVRWDLSISMIPAIKAITNIPVIVDGSHGTGRRDLVAPMTLAGVAAGADGCLVETHPDPEFSLSDSDQALSFEEYKTLMIKTERVRGAIK